MSKPSLFRPTAESVFNRFSPLDAAQRVDAQDAISQLTDQQLEAEMNALQEEENAQELALRLRGEARRDSLTAVARARQRAGGDPAIWDVMGADTAWLIVDLLLKVQGMPIAALDPAYDDKEERRAIGEAAAVEKSLRAAAAYPKESPRYTVPPDLIAETMSKVRNARDKELDNFAD